MRLARPELVQAAGCGGHRDLSRGPGHDQQPQRPNRPRRPGQRDRHGRRQHLLPVSRRAVGRAARADPRGAGEACRPHRCHPAADPHARDGSRERRACALANHRQPAERRPGRADRRRALARGRRVCRRARYLLEAQSRAAREERGSRRAGRRCAPTRRRPRQDPARWGNRASARGRPGRSAAAASGDRERRRSDPGAALGIAQDRGALRGRRCQAGRRTLGAGCGRAVARPAEDTRDPAGQRLGAGGQQARLRGRKLRDHPGAARSCRRAGQRAGRALRPDCRAQGESGAARRPLLGSRRARRAPVRGSARRRGPGSGREAARRDPQERARTVSPVLLSCLLPWRRPAGATQDGAAGWRGTGSFGHRNGAAPRGRDPGGRLFRAGLRPSLDLGRAGLLHRDRQGPTDPRRAARRPGGR